MWNIGKAVFTFCVLVSCLDQYDCADYCELKCNGRENTMCKYPAKVSADCTDYDSSKSILSQSQKEEILDAHNQNRSRVAEGIEVPQPAAADTMELVWDKEVEEIARRWANQCQYEHDACRKSLDGVRIGQNLAINTQTDINVTAHVAAWFSEVSQFKSAGLGSYQGGSGTGHYTQLVWAESRKIGCAKSVYRYKQFGNEMSVFMVCNYSPGGNMLNAKVYTAGEKCSKCPDGYKCSSKYPGLCENPDKSTFADDTGSGSGSSTAMIIKINPELIVSLIIFATLYNC